MKNTQLKGFSFIEILMIITILALISVVAYTSFGVRQNNAVNTKIQSEIISLGNALLLAKQENNLLPQPQGNRNFFAEDTSYVHDFEDNEAFGVHGFITHNTLAKKYIDIIPVDPRTGSFYAYGKTKGTGSIAEMYEIAGVILDGDTYISYITGDYTAENGPYNLIREYNGPNFVYNESTINFPYNPLERILTANIDSYTGSVSINGIETYTEDQLLNYELKSGDTIEVKQNGVVELYYSDGSRSVLGDTSNDTILTLQKMEFIQDNNIITDIKLVLDSGMIWNKAASLDDESGFEIYTTDSTAAVRGTIFGVQKNDSIGSEIVVKKGTVSVNKIDKAGGMVSEESIKILIKNNDTVPTKLVNFSTPGITELNGESVIEVINDTEVGLGISTSGGEMPNSTGSIDDIPNIIKDDTINNNPIINSNMNISLREYFYSSSTSSVNIVINVPERIYNNADFIVMNGKDIIPKNLWGNAAIHSGSTYVQTLNTDTGAPSKSITKDDLAIKEPRIKDSINATGLDAGSEGELSLPEQTNLFNFVTSTYANPPVLSNFYDYIQNKYNHGEKSFTLQYGKKSLNGKIRLTNKVKFTLIDEKSYDSEDNENDNIDEEDIEEEHEKQVNEDRGTEKACNGFSFTNINLEEKCAKYTLDDKTWDLVAFAPYDNAGDLNLYQKGGFKTNNYYNNSPGKDNFITGINCLASIIGQCGKNNTDFGADTYLKDESFATYNGTSPVTKGFYIDNDNSYVDKFKYYKSHLNNLELDNNDDFIIEMRVNGLNRAGGPYKILKYGNLDLELDTGCIKLNSNSYPYNVSGFHILRIKYNNSLTKLELYIDGSKVLGPLTVSANIETQNIYLGNNYQFGNYIQQYDHIIDYLKIYKK